MIFVDVSANCIQHDYRTVEGRTADAMGKKDEWNKDCSRGNGAYRDYIWVRSKTGV